jgi:hypothetical protein
MADEIKYPCVMKATGSCGVIVNMTAYGVGTVAGGGHTTGQERYHIGYHCASWQMQYFEVYKG